MSAAALSAHAAIPSCRHGEAKVGHSWPTVNEREVRGPG
jgi:hypothetical protein